MWTNSFMIGHVLYYSGRSLTVRQIVGAVREVFAVELTRREIRLACNEMTELRRDGLGAYRIHHRFREDRLVRELMAA